MPSCFCNFHGSGGIRASQCQLTYPSSWYRCTDVMVRPLGWQNTGEPPMTSKWQTSGRVMTFFCSKSFWGAVGERIFTYNRNHLFLLKTYSGKKLKASDKSFLWISAVLVSCSVLWTPESNSPLTLTPLPLPLPLMLPPPLPLSLSFLWPFPPLCLPPTLEKVEMSILDSWNITIKRNAYIADSKQKKKHIQDLPCMCYTV